MGYGIEGDPNEFAEKPDETEVPAVPPFPVILHFKNGQHMTFMCTKFDPQYDRAGNIVFGKFEQAPVVEGEPTLIWVDWNEVQMITSEAMEEPE